MKTIQFIILGCVKTKHETSCPVPAADLYSSPLWRKRRAYAEQSGSRWAILSAEHGLLMPDHRIETYDRHIRQAPPEWLGIVSAQLHALAGDYPEHTLTLELHAGADYVKKLQRAVERSGAAIDITTPLAGLQIGEQLRWYNKRQELHQTTGDNMQDKIIEVFAGSVPLDADGNMSE